MVSLRTELLHTLFPRERFPSIRMRPLDSVLMTALKARLGHVIPGGCGLKYADVMDAADNLGDSSCLLVKGGIVRDLMYEGASAKMRDVDIAFHGMDVDELKTRILAGKKKCNGSIIKVSRGIGYLVIGDDPDDRLEAMALKTYDCYSDGRCNSLFIDVRAGLLIDPTGSGEEDARAHVWQMPCDNPDLWLKSTRISLWRMLKFQTASPPYTVPDSTAVTVYRAWYHERDTIPDAAWRGVTFRHVDPSRILEVVALIVAEVDRLLGAGKLDFAGANMVQVLVQKGVLIPYLRPNANIAVHEKTPKKKMHKKR